MADEPRVVLTDPTPLRRATDQCPECRSGADRRVPSAGFGLPHDVCSRCGHEFSLEESCGR